MSAARTGENRRVVLIAVAAAGVLGWGLLSGLALPRWARLQQLREQATISEKKIERLRRLVKRKPAIEQAYQRDADMRSADPDPIIQRIFLDELEQLTQGRNLQMNLKPKTAPDDRQSDRVVVDVEIDATQDSLLEFLDQLFAWPRLIELERLIISASPSKEYPLRASLTVNKVILRPASAHREGKAKKPKT